MKPQELVHEEITVWIPMSDGCRLAARIWRPHDALENPVPAILEYLPYRRRDGTINRDETKYTYLAKNGYAGIRVDIRGSGDSEGLLFDEYARQEQDDGLEVIAWLAEQPWCSGSVGMWGISWGGFNALQVAARRPPALKAIMTLCSTDNRYSDDAHYKGGCLTEENLKWGTMFLGTSSLPPDPDVVGQKWRKIWLERLEKMTCYPELWMQHPTFDDYWKHGSVCINYDDIQCPVYAVGGWADGYANTIPRLMKNLSVPCKALIGPWGHAFPHEAAPGPAIDFLNQSIRWWDYWLKGIDTGIMNESKWNIWVQESIKPASEYKIRPGYWTNTDVWPPENVGTTTYYLNPEGLKTSAQPESILPIHSPLTTGLKSGDWCSFGMGPDQPVDQRSDDGQSLCFDTGHLENDVEVIGAPTVQLNLSTDCKKAHIITRLCDVAPDGTSLFVSYGVLNLNFRNGFDNSNPIKQGEIYQISIQLDDCAHIFPKDHRIRIALSTNYWPMIWPAAESSTLFLQSGISKLELPTRDSMRNTAEMPETFGPPEKLVPTICQLLGAPSQSKAGYNHDTDQKITETKRGFGFGSVRVTDINLDRSDSSILTNRINDNDPLSAESDSFYNLQLKRGDWKVTTKVKLKLSATSDAYKLTGLLEAYEKDVRIYTRNWNYSIPR
jgi:uncharacterized protein